MNFAGDVKVAGEDVASRSHCVILRLCTLRVPETGVGCDLQMVRNCNCPPHSRQ